VSWLGRGQTVLPPSPGRTDLVRTSESPRPTGRGLELAMLAVLILGYLANVVTPSWITQPG